MENLARYIIWASFSPERMSYVEEDGIVVYRSKDGAAQEIFDTLEWLAAMCFHVPDKGEQMVRYYGFYSNFSKTNGTSRTKTASYRAFSRLMYQRKGVRGTGPGLSTSGGLIRKIYEVDVLVCQECKGQMRIAGF